MSSFLHTIIDSVTSFFVAVAITVGFTAAPIAAPVVTPAEPSTTATSSSEVSQQVELQSPIPEDSELQAGEAGSATAELEMEQKRIRQLEQNLEQEKRLREAQQAATLESQRQLELQRQRDQEQARLLEEQKRSAMAEETKRQQEIMRQQELTRKNEEEREQAELEQEKQLYQQKQQLLDTLISQVSGIYQQKINLEQAYRAQEDQFITTYCKQREDEIDNNFGVRGLFFSGARVKAIEDSRVMCPAEARSVFNASLSDKMYPFVIQLQQMQRQFQDYNRSLYSACARVSTNSSIYLDAAFPINF